MASCRCSTVVWVYRLVRNITGDGASADLLDGGEAGVPEDVAPELLVDAALLLAVAHRVINLIRVAGIAVGGDEEGS